MPHSIIEPEDAARGRACNCICPGCQAPLLSRHPKEHRVHFAHDSKHPDARPEEECPFSSAVAIAMMAREISDQFIGNTILIPELNCRHHFDCCADIIDLMVTTQKCLTITSARKKPVLAGQIFDLEIGFGNAKVFIDLFYKGKPQQHLLDSDVFVKVKAGVLAINCDSFDAEILAAEKKLRFSDAVQNFLLHTGMRVWSFNPRQETMLANAASFHECKPVNRLWDDVAGEHYAPRSTLKKPITPLPFEPKIYRCAMCKQEWLQKQVGPPVCPQCNTHLFAAST